MSYFEFRPYVPVAERQRKAQREMAKLAKKGQTILPVKIEGRKIAQTFWGKAWCDHLESYSDYANRLPRGRTYVRNGSVVHLEVRAGEIEATVSGSELYKVKISIVPVVKPKWQKLCQGCAGDIGSLVELLQGRLSNRVMSVITCKETGLFPSPSEIKLKCSCPDWADMCKHVAAVLYGVGARLDQSPELLFLLRSVRHEELVTQASAATDLTAKATSGAPELSDSDISSVFGIELDTQMAPPPTASPLVKTGTPRKKKKTPAKIKSEASGRAKTRGKKAQPQRKARKKAGR